MDLIQEQLNLAMDRIRTESVHSINRLVELLRQHRSTNLYFLGVGKNEPIAQLFSDYLKSIGYQAFPLHYGNLIHGDLGCVRPEHLVVLISKSGNTDELLRVAPRLPRDKTVLLTQNASGQLQGLTGHQVVLPSIREIDGFHGLLPVTSGLLFHLLINLVVCQLLTGDPLELDRYHRYHPEGSIGFQTCRIADCLVDPKKVPRVSPETSLKEAMMQMIGHHLGCCLVIDNDRVIGFFTDQDLRSHLICGVGLEEPVSRVANERFTYLTDLEQRLRPDQPYLYLPVLDSERRLVGLVVNRHHHRHDLLNLGNRF
jgi:arabinose-5-phosphate isomerase